MIEINNLTKRFDDKVALSSISFSVPKGSVYGLVGSNGSGKSTLLRLISGVYFPDGGEVLVNGSAPFNNADIKRKIYYLADNPYFVHQASINEMAKLYKGIYPSFDNEKFRYLKSVFPLETKAKISTMSKGMQRQAALMLALSLNPEYLLLDEAFDGLDPVMRKVLKTLLTDGAAEGMTTIIASHNLRDLDYLCDRVGLIHFGEVVFNDEIERVKSSIHKVQVAFERVPDVSVFSALNVIKLERTGSLLQLIVKGEEAEILKFMNQLNPTFVELINPDFEEVFMYELEVKGYDAENIIK